MGKMAQRRPLIMDDDAPSPQTVSECMAKEDPNNDRFPFCVVWTGLPLITPLFPFIGHLGICDSKGRVWDFDSPYHVGVCFIFSFPFNFFVLFLFFPLQVDRMAFERPRRYP